MTIAMHIFLWKEEQVLQALMMLTETIESSESFVENKIKNETEQLLSKYKHGNNIHEHGKQKKKNHITLILICHKN